MSDLSKAIAECLALHAEAVEQFGTETPEENPALPPELQAKLAQARTNVNVTLTGSSVDQHVLHIQTLCRGLRLVMRKLSGC
jgi:hypothetical protein